MAGNEGAPQPHMYALPVGTLLHEFRIDGLLGHGGFGITYRAFDTDLHKAVAIKEYLPNDLAGRASDTTVRAKSADDQQQFEQGVAAFLDEARLVARLRHRNIMEVHRFFKLNGTGYIVLGYEEGRTLKQRLDQGPLSESELRKVLGGLLDGIEVLHNEAILHRDIKPSNIILSDSRVSGERGVPVLIDFGAARDFRSRHSRSVTTIVAPGYAPPEQYGVGGQAGPWSDLYALGATAYRCVTGQAPPEALRRLRKDPYVPAVEVAAGRYDENLLHLIDRMLAVEEIERPQSAGEVREELNSRRVLRSQPKPSRERRPIASNDATAPSRRRRLPAILGALSAAAVIAIVAVGATLWVDGTIPKLLGTAEVKTTTAPATSTPTVPSVVVATDSKAIDTPKTDVASPTPKAVETPKTDAPIKTATAASVEATPPPVVKRTLVDAVAAGFEPVANAGALNHSSVASIAISPDGRTLASVSFGVALWDIASSRKLRQLTRGIFPPLNSVSSETVAFSPDGQTLAVGSLDNTITLWDVASGRELRKYKSDTYSLAFSPDGRTLASGSSDRIIKLWDVASGRELRTLNLNEPSIGLSQPVFAIAFSPLGRVLASGSLGSFKLWDVTSGRELWSRIGSRGVTFSPDGRLLAAGDDDIRLWDVASGRKLRTLQMAKPLSTVQSVMFAPDGRTLASGVINDGPGIKLWDVATGRELRTLPPGDEFANKMPIAFLPDGRTLAAGSKNGTINFWSTSDGSLKARYIDMSVFGSISFDGKGLPIAVTGYEDQIYHFVKDDKWIKPSEMRALGYDLPAPSPVVMPANN